jgi:PAS domain-containing protein
MRSANLIDSLPDAICVVDTSANIKQWNKQFMRMFFGCRSELLNVTSNTNDKVNFVNDILHPDHRQRFAAALSMLRTSDKFDGEIRCVALRSLMSRTKSPQTSGKIEKIDIVVRQLLGNWEINNILLICLDSVSRLVHWTMSSTDREDTLVLVGRNPDVEVVGPDCATNRKLIEDVSSSADISRAAAVEEPSSYPWHTASSKSGLTSEPASKVLESYLKTAPVPLHLLSGAGIILWANDSELQLVGYSSDEYIGHEISEVE